jgi:hypothetical protein
MIVKGYDYGAFCRGIAERDGVLCWVRVLLIARRAAMVKKWAGSAADSPPSACREWIPNGLMDCDGPLDGHHAALSKSWLKSYAATLEREGEPVDLAGWLNDHRQGRLACRRHHDLVERRLIVVRRGDLPEELDEFLAELGDRAVARVERDFGVLPGPGEVPARGGTA